MQRFRLDEDEGADGDMHILGMTEADEGEWVRYDAVEEHVREVRMAIAKDLSNQDPVVDDPVWLRNEVRRLRVVVKAQYGELERLRARLGELEAAIIRSNATGQVDLLAMWNRECARARQALAEIAKLTAQNHRLVGRIDELKAEGMWMGPEGREDEP